MKFFLSMVVSLSLTVTFCYPDLSDPRFIDFEAHTGMEDIKAEMTDLLTRMTAIQTSLNYYATLSGGDWNMREADDRYQWIINLGNFDEDSVRIQIIEGSMMRVLAKQTAEFQNVTSTDAGQTHSYGFSSGQASYNFSLPGDADVEKYSTEKKGHELIITMLRRKD